MNLSGKVIVITGGAKGLGSALAQLFSVKGSRVVITDNNKKGLKQKAAELGIDGFFMDVTNEESVFEAAEKIFKKFGRIDIWINNAGIWMPRQNLEEINIQKAKRLFEVNVFGCIHGSRAALLKMKKQKEGILMHISSTTAFDGMNGSSSAMYVASKYAVRGFTNALREQLKEIAIQVIGVYPGGMKTEIFTDSRPATFDQFMLPEDVARKIIENLEREKPEEELILKRVDNLIVLLK